MRSSVHEAVSSGVHDVTRLHTESLGLTAYGARTVELNLEPSDAQVAFDEVHTGPATMIVPAWVDAMSTA
jgi:NAD-dependent SIR2 family protein deacetylase